MVETAPLDAKRLYELGRQLRVDAVRAADAAASGHPTSSMSGADLMAVLASRYLRYDVQAPGEPGGDRLIFSKGHASPLLYALLHAMGAVSDEELLTFRAHGSRLEGHPTPRLPWAPVATGSLGQGLPIGVGTALAGKHLDRLPYRTWVLCGDSELAEGSIWEAFEQAGYSELDNLVAIVDVNRLGQRGPTRHEWDTAAYARRIGAFGWQTIEIDGHDLAEIDGAYQQALATSGRPTAILARTYKGSGVSAVENAEGAHGKPLSDAKSAIAELGGRRDLRIEVTPPERGLRPHRFPVRESKSPEYQLGEKEATRTAFGEALTALGTRRGDVVGLDGEVSDSTRLGYFADAHPDRFFECYIAEQQMLAAAVGMQTSGWVPYVATFAAFLSRAYDFVRMAAISRARLNLVGSHAGVAIGKDGPSQMALEDLASLRAVHGSAVLYPCDGNQAAALAPLMADHDGIAYLRASRGATPVIYPAGEDFRVGGSKMPRSSTDDRVTIVGAGATLHEALAAYDRLANEGIRARVIDLYSVKPVDGEAVRSAAGATGTIVTVEDHWPEGGLGDAVLECVADMPTPPRVRKLAVNAMPASATPDEQLADAGINADAIVRAARDLVT